MRRTSCFAAFAVIAIFFLTAPATRARTLTTPAGNSGATARALPLERVHATLQPPPQPAWDEPTVANCSQTGIGPGKKPIESCCPPAGMGGACVRFNATGPIRKNPDGAINPEVCYAIWEAGSNVSFNCYYESD